MSGWVAPPSGWPAPATATLQGRAIHLAPLAEDIAARYFAEFPDDIERDGDAARAWEIHDTAYCLQWAILDAEGFDVLERQVAWLKRVLGARDFPLERLARNLELAADALAEALGEPGELVAAALQEAAGAVRAPA